MNQVILHISYLLSHHDCVVVPGLGAFLNHYRSGWIDEDSLDFHAPALSVGFNPEIDYNDWMIADSISRREGISREAAMKLVTDEVKALRYQLETDREVSLGEIGLLRFCGGETPEFIPSYFENPYAGLPTIGCADTTDAVAPAEETETVTQGRKFLHLGGFLRVAACFAAILMAATLFLHFSTSQEKADEHFAAIDSGLSAYALADALWGDSTPPATPELLIAASPVDDAEVAAPKARVETVTAPSSASREIRLNGEDPYLVIVASFTTPAQAETFVNQHKGINLGVFLADGYYRIYAASSTTLAGAVSSADSPGLREHFAQSWVLRQ